MVFSITDCAEKMSDIAARYYENPSQSMQIVAVTGTNGKTSVCYYSAYILNAMGVRTGIIGTLGYGIYPSIKDTGYTTHDAITTQACLAALRDAGCKVVMMEISSHALMLGRVSAVCFHTAVLTQITEDHLDFHGSLDKYISAKQILFGWPNLHSVVINCDDASGRLFLQDSSEKCPTMQRMGYGIEESLYTNHMLRLVDYRLEAHGIQLHVNADGLAYECWLPLLGLYNIYNALAMFGVLHSLGYSVQKVLPYVDHIQAVAGRMQLFRFPNNIQIVVDFAHTTDALEKVLATLDTLPHRRIICVFGCGGARDRTKRPMMAEVAAKYAELIIVTEDNNRGENCQNIFNDIIGGFSENVNYRCIKQRPQAIDYAWQHAVRNDIILVAGKGHESYIDRGHCKVQHSDVEYINALMCRSINKESKATG